MKGICRWVCFVDSSRRVQYWWFNVYWKVVFSKKSGGLVIAKCLREWIRTENVVGVDGVGGGLWGGWVLGGGVFVMPAFDSIDWIAAREGRVADSLAIWLRWVWATVCVLSVRDGSMENEFWWGNAGGCTVPL